MAESADFVIESKLSGPITELHQAPQFPRVAVPVSRALNRLYKISAPIAITHESQEYWLRWKYTDVPPELENAEGLYRFKLGQHLGTLRLEPRLHARVLREPHPYALPLDLRYLLVANTLHPLVERIEQASRLRLEWLTDTEETASLSAASHTRAHFLVTQENEKWSGGGSIHIDNPDAFETLTLALAGPLGPSSAHPHFSELIVPLPFSVGNTHISVREMSTIRSGDIISVEEWRSQGAGIYVKAVLGHTELIGVAEGSKIFIKQWKDISMENRSGPGSPDVSDNANLPLDRLDAMEVTLRFEVGELTVSLGDLKGIKPGHVFELTQPLNRSLVRIITAGNVLGKGYLVAIGDRLGVRVSEFAPTQNE